MRECVGFFSSLLNPLSPPPPKAVQSNEVYLPQEALMVSLSLEARQINADRWAFKADRRRRGTRAIITFLICIRHTEGNTKECLPLKTICSRYVS